MGDGGAARALAASQHGYHRGTEAQRHRVVGSLREFSAPSVSPCLCVSVIGRPRSAVACSRFARVFASQAWGRRAFTLVEALIALVLASILLAGLLSYFGFALQGFAQQEDTLTGSRDAQILLAYLRADINAADGLDSSATATTGTTFPKSQVHLIQTMGQTGLQPYIYTRRQEPVVRPGEDPCRDPMTVEARTVAWLKLLDLPTDDTVADYVPPGQATNDLLRAINYTMNAAVWIRPSEPEKDRILALNVREGSMTAPVTYVYQPAARRILRKATTGVTVIGDGMVESFSASPYYEFLVTPPPAGSTAELIKVWIELSFSLRAKDDGAKIAKRGLSFSTRILPRYLNEVIKTRWGL